MVASGHASGISVSECGIKTFDGFFVLHELVTSGYCVSGYKLNELNYFLILNKDRIYKSGQSRLLIKTYYYGSKTNY